jgi:hypothetical protein
MIMELVTGLMSGGATGLIGLVLQAWNDGRKRADDIALAKLQNEATLQLRRAEIEREVAMARMTAESAERVEQMRQESRLAELGSSDYQASMASDRATYSPPGAADKYPFIAIMLAMVDVVRGLTRPGITIYSLSVLTGLAWWVTTLYGKMGLQMPANDVMKLATDIISTVEYVAVTSAVWWFGARAQSKK